MSKAMPDAASGKGQPRQYVTITLEMSEKAFSKRRRSFIRDLSEASGIDASELAIVSVRTGCIKVLTDVPAEHAEALAGRKGDENLPPALIELRDLFGWPVVLVRHGENLSQAPLEATADPQSYDFSWLHLSDIHLHAEHGGKEWSQNVVRKAFERDVPGLLKGANVVPSVVLITGDVAYSGKEEEYQRAFSLLTDLQAALPGRPPIVHIPGNHDVCWDDVAPEVDSALRDELNDSQQVIDFMVERRERARRRSSQLKFENYARFRDRCHAELSGSIEIEVGESGFYVQTKMATEAGSVGIAGLNSAWLCTRDADEATDRGQLVLGEPLLSGALEHLDGADLKIALIHHPPGHLWYRDFDRRGQDAYLVSFDVVLTGHEHEDDAHTQHDLGEGRTQLRVAAGALYTPEHGSGSDTGYPKSFNAARVSLSDRRGLLYFWRYHGRVKRWRADVSRFARGYTKFSL